MINRKVKQFCFSFIVVLLSITFFNCQNHFNSGLDEDEPEEKPSAGMGMVRLEIVDLYDDVSHRTIFPVSPVITSYEISFAPKSGQQTKEKERYETNVIAGIELDAGKWIITVHGMAIFEGQEKEVAEGSSGLIDVITNDNISISITLRSKTLESGLGIFSWELIVPNGIEADSWSMILYEWDNESNRIIDIDEDINTGSSGITIAGSEMCENGYYMLEISLGTDRQRVFYFDAVHIYANRTTTFDHQVSFDEFVPVLVLSGTAKVSLVYNGTPIRQENDLERLEVWAYSPEGERVAYAKVVHEEWQMRIVKPAQIRDLHFRLNFAIVGHQEFPIELISNETRAVYQNDVSGINIAINRSIFNLRGTLTAHTPTNIPKSDWEIRAYTTSQDYESSTLALNENIVKTNANGEWSMIIDAFDIPAIPMEIFFSVEKIYAGKKYRRIIQRIVTNNNAAALTAYFTPPKQIWINGNIIGNAQTTMLPFRSSLSQEDYGRFTFTKTGLENQTPCFFNILAYLDREVSAPDWNQADGTIAKYDYQNIIKSAVGENFYDNNGVIEWHNISSDQRLPDQDNVLITLDFRNDEYFESGKPLLKIEKRDEVFINQGTFVMGSPTGEQGREGPSGKSGEIQHTVQLSAFIIMPTEVTQRMYEKLMPVPSYKNTNGRNFINPQFPVVNISWFDAVEFANKLSIEDGLTPVYTITGTGSDRTVSADWDSPGWRLPTEAEWEYAARAGSSTTFAPIGSSDGTTLHTSFANFNGEAVDSLGYNPIPGFYRGCIIEANSFSPNAWGLHNMHGNVWEFCWDWFGDYITNETQIDPRGPQDGASGILGVTEYPEPSGQRIIRGGSYYNSTRYLRSAHRGVIFPDNNTYNDIGFRLVRKM